MLIIGLDVATNTGIAVGNSSDKPKCWSVNLGEPNRAGKMSKADKDRLDNRRFSNVLKLTHGLIETHKPDLIVIEAFIGGMNASAYLIGLVACIRGCAFNQGVKCELVFPATTRKHFIGKAKTSKDFPGLKPAKAKLAIKQEVKARCEQMKWVIPDLDAADAAATWDWACATHARQYQAKPSGGLFKNG
tara:strand:- start:15426 stop:15992 length:567 start_codon:yes stop_codon:yes gene_type:complete